MTTRARTMQKEAGDGQDLSSEDWYADFLLSWLRSLPAVWRVSAMTIGPTLSTVRVDEHAAYQRDGETIAEAASRVLIDLGHEPPLRPSVQDVRGYTRRLMNASRGGGIADLVGEFLYALQQAAASSDPRERMLATAAIAGVGADADVRYPERTLS